MKKIFYPILIITFFFSALQTNAQSKFALSFNGTNNHVLCGNRGDLVFSGTSTYTMEAWIKPMGSGSRTILSKHKRFGEGTYIFGIDANNKLFMTRAAATTTSSITVPNGIYTHVAASYDGNNVRLYINGQLDVTAAVGATGTSPFIDVVMGASYDPSSVLMNYFNGSIDELKVWNTVRSQAEIAAFLYQETRVSTLGLVAYYKCNEGSGTTLTDSKTGPNGTLVNSPAWEASGANISETSFFGNALHFDGVNDHEVNTGPHPQLDFSGTSFTLQATVYPTGVGSNFGQGMIFSNEGRYQFGRDNNGDLFINVSSPSFYYGFDIRTSLFLPLNTWTEITIVYDHTLGKISAYLNGGIQLPFNGPVQSYSTIIPGTLDDYLPALNDVVIGGRQAVSHNFNGSIDELKVWNYAKTATQIKSEVNLPTNPAATGLMAYYRFDEGLANGNNAAATWLLDVSPNKFHGTLLNFGLNGATSNWVSNSKYYKWTGDANSNWTDGSNWETDVFPGASANVYIPAGMPNTPVINNTQSVNHLIIGANVPVNLNNVSFNVAGNLFKYGPFTGTGTLVLNGTTDQQIYGKGSIQNLTVNNPPAYVASLHDSTDLFGVIVANTDATLWTGRSLTMKSNINGTARVGYSPGRLLDSVNIERYFPNIGKRAWHLVTYSSHCHQLLYYCWQEAGANIPGKGTLITSNLYNGTNGFDMASNSSSILTYNQGDGGGSSWNYNFPSTLVDGSLRQGYMLFIRGDRSYTANTPGTSATTLTHTGIFWQPYRNQLPVTVKAIGSGYTLVGNPYASPIDFETIHNVTNLRQNFYIWDPLLTGTYGLGAYRLVQRTAGGAYQATPSLGASQDALLRYINAGMAFLLKADGGDAIVGFDENSKAAINGPVNPIVATPGDQQILVHLQIAEPGSEPAIVDGLRVRYDNSYSTGIVDDVEKMSNFSENISSWREGKRLIVENRPMIEGTDTIFIQLNKTGIKKYRYQIASIDFVQSNTKAFLQDTYLNTDTPIDLSGTDNFIDFNITSDPASANENRFRIIFKVTSPSDVSFTQVGAVQQLNNIRVDWKVSNQVNIQKYEVEKSTDGINFIKVDSQPSIGVNGSDGSYNWLDVNGVLGDNYYRIRSIGLNGAVKLSQTVLIRINKGKPEITIYPNPVVNKTIHVQFNNMETGVYQLKLMNKLGQVVLTKSVNHSGGNAIIKLEVNKITARGLYMLEINKPGNNKQVTKQVTISE